MRSLAVVKSAVGVFFAWIVDVIAANSEPNTMLLFFLWAIIAAYAAVGGAFVSWNVQFGYEKMCQCRGGF